MPSRLSAALSGAVVSALAVIGVLTWIAERPKPVVVEATPALLVSEDPGVEPGEQRISRLAKLLLLIAALVLAGLATVAVYDVRGHNQRIADARRMTGGEPGRGPALIERYGCGGCHTIPGLRTANGIVGPPLAGVGRRVYVGGVLTNTPDNLIGWIVNPKAYSPRTAMPATGITVNEARDVAAYLYTLK